MSNQIYKSPESNVVEAAADNGKASLLIIILTLMFTVPNMLAGYYQQYLASGGNNSQAIGGAIGPVIFSLLIVAVFQIGRRFRVQKARYKIFMWCQIVFFSLTLAGAVARYIELSNA